MKIKHSNVSPVSDKWQDITDCYLRYLRVAGRTRETLRSRREHLHHLGRTIGLEPEEITAEDLIEWCSRQDWAKETRRGRYNTFRLFWEWAHMKQLLPNITGVLPKISQSRGIARPAPEEIYFRALQNSDDRLRRILRLAGEYGLRRNEVVLIRIPDDLIQDGVGWSLIVHGKGGKERQVPLQDDMAYDLMRQEPGWLFPGSSNGHLSASWVGKLVSTALNGNWTMHTLRHRFATRGYQNTRDLHGMQRILGHASSDTTITYIQSSILELRAIVQSVAHLPNPIEHRKPPET